jgi:hypothetical protein
LEKQESLIQVFAPLSEFIFIKDAQMSQKAEDWTESQKLMKQLTELKDAAKVLDLVERVMLLTAETPLLAFKDDPNQRRKFMATTYADEWSGCLGGWFRSWYVCMHGCKWIPFMNKPQMCEGCCGTLVPSKLWGLLHEDDPLADGQRWYCWVTHRYNASWGQVVELMTVSGKLMYAWAEVPSGTIQDIRAMKIERDCPGMTAEQIYDSLPVIPPQTAHGHISVHHLAPACEPGKERWFSMEPDFFNSLPVFPWNQIFNLAGAPMKVAQATGKDAQKKVWWDVDAKKKQLAASIASREGTASSAASEGPLPKSASAEAPW